MASTCTASGHGRASMSELWTRTPLQRGQACSPRTGYCRYLSELSAAALLDPAERSLGVLKLVGHLGKQLEFLVFKLSGRYHYESIFCPFKGQLLL